ncbi:DEAD/DEAH box helicase [Pseudomonas amygdali pv. ulmi]|uniref:DEAD/DEAH box helicase n=2 Tax=Pseudomonas syringae group TaxID=136849 RepID=A0A0N8TEY8_PSEA0|nr:DUF3275 family protein [Pseudomonas amygdali]KPZ17713.1 DEAD/DEAH box helicase [Pseudomonas amygdali pv. ulmi]KWS10205.1 hypothetical protein AL065_06665 [Pseudomonas amygdali pv. ulmi]
MINLPGYLAIRTINGRNGEFNVGRLSTSIGEFVIKDALLDQYPEGKYRGDFAITEIRPSYYTNGGRLVVEIRARLDTRDTTSRMKRVLEQSGLKVAVLRASVDTARREDWILDQVDRGVDVLITNPELVKTGLDLLDFPTIAFMQTGYNVYTVQQAARRSWRIGQKQDVRVIFFGYIGSSQITCLQLMAKKIAVSQSTSGDVPESGLDSLNQDGDSVEMALARQIINA